VAVTERGVILLGSSVFRCFVRILRCYRQLFRCSQTCRIIKNALKYNRLGRVAYAENRNFSLLFPSNSGIGGLGILFGERRLQPIEEVERRARAQLVGADVAQHGVDLGVARHRLRAGGRLGAPAGGAKERQIVGEVGEGTPFLALFEEGQDLLGARRDTLRQPGEPCHMDAVGAIGGARTYLVQKDDIPLPFLDPHRVAGERRQLDGKRRQFVVMRREQGAAAIDLVQMFETGPGDRQPVEGRRAAADLVEDDEGIGAGLVQDRRRLDHLDHEGRTAARQIVGRPHPAEQPVDDADPGALRRHLRARLREDRDQRVLPQKGALPRHVGAGDEPDPVGRQGAVVGDEAVAFGGQCRLDRRVAAAGDLERGAGLDDRPHPAAFDRPLGERRRQVERPVI
jgi:hypothetical protein